MARSVTGSIVNASCGALLSSRRREELLLNIGLFAVLDLITPLIWAFFVPERAEVA